MSNVPEPKIYFSREQYEYLAKIFPEVLGTENTTHADFLVHTGKRQVVHFIKSRVRQ